MQHDGKPRNRITQTRPLSGEHSTHRREKYQQIGKKVSSEGTSTDCPDFTDSFGPAKLTPRRDRFFLSRKVQA